MLIRYKKSFEKIAMGLLSFMPEVEDVKSLQEIIGEYDQNPDWQLFLWKDVDILGAVGIQFKGTEAIIQHVSVNPSHRNTGIGKKMVEKVHEHYHERYHVCANTATRSFVERCETEHPSTQV